MGCTLIKTSILNFHEKERTGTKNRAVSKNVMRRREWVQKTEPSAKTDKKERTDTKNKDVSKNVMRRRERVQKQSHQQKRDKKERTGTKNRAQI